MMLRFRRWGLPGLFSLTAGVTLSGCLFAAAAGAGSAIYLTDRGAESLVSTSVDETFAAVQATFQELGINETKRSSEGDTQRELQGSEGDRNVTVQIKREDESTKVEVTARTGTVTWDKDYAKMVLEKIVNRTSG
jgi:hypothetical protein